MGRLTILVSFLLLLCCASFAAAQEGLVAYYSFDGDSGTVALDKSGKGNNASLIGGVTWVKGKFGQALEFDGKKSGLDCGNPANGSFNMGNGNFTVELWIKTVQTGPGVSLVTKSTNYPYWLLGIDNGKLHIGISDGKGSVGTGPNASNVNINDGNWHHIAFAVDRGAEAVVYIDGKLDMVASMYGVAGSMDNSSSLAIGYYWANCFQGAIDELRVYKKALDADEIGKDFAGAYRTGI